MKIRPWPIVLLALMHILEPVFNGLLNWLVFGVDYIDYIKAVMAGPYGGLKAISFFLFPIAGISIYMFKKWSLPVFLIVETIVLAININFISHLVQNEQYARLATCSLLYVANILVVLYLLLPTVREWYLNDRLKWWEFAKRFNLVLDCKFVGLEEAEGRVFNGKIHNLSETGLYITSEEKLPENSKYYIKFSFGNLEFNLLLNIVHAVSYNGIDGYGAQFVNLTREQNKKLQRLTKALVMLDLMMERDRIDYLREFLNWAKNVGKTGKGLIPVSGNGATQGKEEIQEKKAG